MRRRTLLATSAATGLAAVVPGFASARTRPPRVRFEEPDDGDTVSGVVDVEIRAKERDEDVDRTEVFVDGELVTTRTAERFTVSWDTSGLSGGHTITAIAHDVEGNTRSASITLFVEGEDEPPEEEDDEADATGDDEGDGADGDDEDDGDDETDGGGDGDEEDDGADGGEEGGAGDDEEDDGTDDEDDDTGGDVSGDVPVLESVRLSHSNVRGGNSVTGIAAFDRPPIEGQGWRTFLHSSDPDVAQVPEETFWAWSETERAFDVSTTAVDEEVAVTITAEGCCVAEGEASATLTVSPDGVDTTDVVEITRARWEPGLLEVRATSTSETALLTVYIQGSITGNDIELFDLEHVGGGRYVGERVDDGRLSNPGTVDVRSNLGGSDTAEVQE